MATNASNGLKRLEYTLLQRKQNLSAEIRCSTGAILKTVMKTKQLPQSLHSNNSVHTQLQTEIAHKITYMQNTNDEL
jgi:hypothetical protein